MPAFPLRLSPVDYSSTRVTPVIESASSKSCLARASFKPRNIRYETFVRLEEGKWLIDTKHDGHPAHDDYPLACAYRVGFAVINWWIGAYSVDAAPLPSEVAAPRAAWLARSAHKLLTEVGEYPDQLAALGILASTYHLGPLPTGLSPSLKGAQWASNAHRYLERDVPEAERCRTLVLLVEMITGSRVTPEVPTTPAATLRPNPILQLTRP